MGGRVEGSGPALSGSCTDAGTPHRRGQGAEAAISGRFEPLSWLKCNLAKGLDVEVRTPEPMRAGRGSGHFGPV